VTHYENFPVASWLCPPHLRAPIAAIYHFARTADDVADEGDAPPGQRLATLQTYRTALNAVCDGQTLDNGPWPEVFEPLRHAIATHHLPPALLHALMDAFVQDIEKTRDGTGYAAMAPLLDYCARSANPVGRLLLHLYGVNDKVSLAQSDAICSALQLINFWQDLSEDIPRGRHYLPNGAQLTEEIAYARALMQQGSPLVHQVAGRGGWELRLVVQGGLRILDKLEKADPLRTRPVIAGPDFAFMAWRACWMRKPR
jgi:squalene synthase HpnC